MVEWKTFHTEYKDSYRKHQPLISGLSASTHYRTLSNQVEMHNTDGWLWDSNGYWLKTLNRRMSATIPLLPPGNETLSFSFEKHMCSSIIILLKIGPTIQNKLDNSRFKFKNTTIEMNFHCKGKGGTSVITT